tara:strand:- start:12593 stop:14014 length:1422 start_codon:yes stop_codon:yes gene_type:complete
MVFNLTLTGNQYKGCVSSDAGVYSLFRSITLLSGDGETVLEELAYYAGAQSTKYHFENNECGNNLQYLHEGRPNKNYCDDTSFNQYCDCTKNDGTHYKTVEVTCPLWNSGILSPLRKTVWPNAYLKGLRIRIELYDNVSMFEGAKVPMFNTDGTASGNYGGYGSESTAYACNAAAINGATVLTLKKQGDAPITEAVLSADVAKPAHVFCPKQWIYAKHSNDTEGTYQIKSIAIDADNRINLTLESGLTAAMAVDGEVWVSDSPDKNDVGFNLDNVRFNVSVAQPPKEFVDTMNSRLKSGKLNLDIDTYTCYPFNLSSGSLSNTIPINARNKRCTSMLSLPMAGGGKSAKVFDKSFTPLLQQPRNYQYSLAGVLTPDRLVNLERLNTGRYDAVHLRELMHALQAAGIKVRDIRDVHTFFAVGRRFALKGYSFDALSQISLNLNFKEMEEPVVLMNYLYHKAQIQVRQNGINVTK